MIKLTQNFELVDISRCNRNIGRVDYDVDAEEYVFSKNLLCLLTTDQEEDVCFIIKEMNGE